MKLCPFCKEKIQDEAVKCKHCGEFLTKQDNLSSIVQYKFPKVWPGYILGLLFLIFEGGEAIVSPQNNKPYTWWSVSFWLIGLIYWCICVYKLHKTIFKITDSHYPITPGQAVGYGFIPFYNLYWIFKWPSEIIGMVNSRVGTKKFKSWIPGLCLLLFTLAGRADGAIWLVGTFAVLSYLIRRIKSRLTIQPEPMPYTDKLTSTSIGIRIAVTCAIAMPILALFAAIAIPNLLRARHNANEASAIVTLKDYYKQQESYRNQNYSYGTIPDFGKNGYRFKLTNLTQYTYTIKAEPINPGVSGSKVFIVDETGVITTIDGKVVEYISER